MWIKNCTFQFNSQDESDEPIIKVLITCNNMTMIFISCLFNENKNISPLLLIEETEFNSAYMNNKFEVVSDNYGCRFPSYIHFRNCCFVNNTGKLMNIHGIKLSECPIQLLLIGPFKVINTESPHFQYEYDDIISIHHVNVSIIDEASFENNSLVRNVLFFDNCLVTFHGSISFIRNEDCYQIITLHSEFAYIKVMENTRILFHHNVVDYIIRIKKEDYITYPLCVFQYIYSTTISKNVSLHALFSDYSISFRDNGGLLLLPTNEVDFSNKLLINYYTFHCKWLPEATFYGYHPGDINKQIIHTDDKQY